MKVRVLIAAALTACLSSGAWAHAHLSQPDPAENSTVAAPTQVRLSFSEGVELAFSEVTLVSDSGETVKTQLSLAQGAPVTVIAIPVSPLKAGAWQVQWKVVSVDTHRSQGQYRFTVQ